MKTITQNLSRQFPEAHVFMSQDGLNYKVSLDLTLSLVEAKDPDVAIKSVMAKLVPKGFVESAEKYDKLVSVMKMLGEEL